MKSKTILWPEDLPTFHLCFFCPKCQIVKSVFRFYLLPLRQIFSSLDYARDDEMIFSHDFCHHDGVYQSACPCEISRFHFDCRSFEISGSPEEYWLSLKEGFTFGLSSTIWSRSWSEGVCWRWFGIFSFEGGKQYSWPSELTVASNKCFGGNGSSVYDRKINTGLQVIEFKVTSLESRFTAFYLQWAWLVLLLTRFEACLDSNCLLSCTSSGSDEYLKHFVKAFVILTSENTLLKIL